MYVCLCKGITQKQIEEAVCRRKGQGTKDILKSLGVGSDCGTCLEGAIEQLLQTSNKNPRHQHTSATANPPTRSE